MCNPCSGPKYTKIFINSLELHCVEMIYIYLAGHPTKIDFVCLFVFIAYQPL